jgi:hypothetical protein
MDPLMLGARRDSSSTMMFKGRVNRPTQNGRSVDVKKNLLFLAIAQRAGKKVSGVRNLFRPELSTKVPDFLPTISPGYFRWHSWLRGLCNPVLTSPAGDRSVTSLRRWCQTRIKQNQNSGRWSANHPAERLPARTASEP